MASWYACSLVTLFLNKSLLTTMRVPVHYLGMGQMCTTCFLGAVKVYGPRMLKKGDGGSKRDLEDGRANANVFYRNLALVGLMRGATVVLGLVSLKHVAASFTEAIKSSAPLFTVVFAWIILKVRTRCVVGVLHASDHCAHRIVCAPLLPLATRFTHALHAPRARNDSPRVIFSLVPVMVGLVITSGTELSFEMVGFLAALSTNCIDCVQNVFSKRLMQQDLTPVELQFYTSAAAITMQLPLMVYLHWGHLVASGEGYTWHVFALLFVACVFYHLQSVAAYYCVDCVAPVTMSVANTLKRGILIVASIWFFGNQITVSTAGGSVMIIGGVGLYNRVRQGEARAATAESKRSSAANARAAQAAVEP
jgi:solute carrier family 35 protein E2